ncbi:MAG TPA: GntR family transcriptional regulator [Anaerolineae bacterium]|jgi:GntR family transcriptional regulator|nr:GntR family transcriptional regulator [Anaerolineae bacterium]
MTTIERESPVPLYYQLKQLLAERIAKGEWQPGDMLPTEEQLQDQYGLSRTTVRQALKELEVEGLISRHRGRGTFVSRPKISHSPDPRFNLTAYLIEQGMQPGWRVISAGWVQATAEVAERLAVDSGVRLYRLRRLRLSSDEPIGYHIAHVIPALGRAVDENHLDQGGSLDYLRATGQLDQSLANRTIEAVLASEEVAKHLDILKGSPILKIRRRVFNAAGVPVEDMRAMYRGDRFQYRVRQRADE